MASSSTSVSVCPNSPTFDLVNDFLKSDSDEMDCDFDNDDVDLIAAAIKCEAACTRPGTSDQDEGKKKERFASLQEVQIENLVRDTECDKTKKSTKYSVKIFRGEIFFF